MGGGVGVDFLLIAGNEEVEDVEVVAAEVAVAAEAEAEGVETAPVELLAVGGAGDDGDFVLGMAEVRKVCDLLVDVEVDALNLTLELPEPFLVSGKLDRRVVGGVMEEDGFAAAGKGGECMTTFSTGINRPDLAGHVK